MRLVQPQSRQRVVSRRHQQPKRWRLLPVALVLMVAFQLLRPLPAATVTLSLPPLPAAQETQLDWPDAETAQASLAAEGYGLLATHGLGTPLATASIAKVITALCVLEKYPLSPGQQGPLLTMGPADVSFYQTEVTRNGSRLPVQTGDQLSEYAALQAIMIPSANNIADSLAVWAFGDSGAYQAYANAYLERHGLTSTRVGTDASGFDPSTVSTAADLVKLASLARQNPVLMEIAGQRAVSFPSAGDYTNYNAALGRSGITGLKTGNNDQNPGALLFTADVPFSRGELHLNGAVLGATSLSDALTASQELVASAGNNFEAIRYAAAGQQVGTAKAKWGATSPVRVKNDLQLTRWKGHALTEKHTLHSIAPAATGEVGALAVQAGEVQASVTLTMPEKLVGPSLWWRLTRL